MTMSTRFVETFASLIVCFAMCVSAAHGTVVALHAGDNDPTTQGWTRVNPFGVDEMGLAPDPDFSGVNAWEIDVPNSGGVEYRHALTAAEQADGAANGWRLTGTMRLESARDNGSNNNGIADIVIQTNELGGSVRAHMDVADSGAPDRQVRERMTGAITQLTGGDKYYTFEFEHMPGNDFVDFSIDGASPTSIPTGGPTTLTPTRVDFGILNGGGESRGTRRFSLVQFQIIPEPTTIVLLGFGLVAMLVHRRRQSA